MDLLRVTYILYCATRRTWRDSRLGTRDAVRESEESALEFSMLSRLPQRSLKSPDDVLHPLEVAHRARKCYQSPEFGGGGG